MESGTTAPRPAIPEGLDCPEAWLALARSLVGLGRFDEAEGAFHQAILRRPLYPAAHSELAQLIWMRSGDVEQACGTLNKMIAALPDNIEFRLIKAKLLEYGDPEAAYAVLVEALEKGSTDLRAEIVAVAAPSCDGSGDGARSCRARPCARTA